MNKASSGRGRTSSASGRGTNTSYGVARSAGSTARNAGVGRVGGVRLGGVVSSSAGRNAVAGALRSLSVGSAYY